MTTCPICYKKPNYITECKHSFCRKCLLRWEKNSCPLCRKFIISPPYPNTRSDWKAVEIINKTRELFIKLETIKNAKEKIKATGEILSYIWDNRVIFRRSWHFRKTAKEKARFLEREIKLAGLAPPKILKKFPRF